MARLGRRMGRSSWNLLIISVARNMIGRRDRESVGISSTPLGLGSLCQIKMNVVCLIGHYHTTFGQGGEHARRQAAGCTTAGTGHTISARRSDCARSAVVCRSSSRRAISSRSSPVSITARSSRLHPVAAARVQAAAEHRELHPLAVTMQQPVDAAPPFSGRDVVGNQILASRWRHDDARLPPSHLRRGLGVAA